MCKSLFTFHIFILDIILYVINNNRVLHISTSVTITTSIFIYRIIIREVLI